MRNAVDRRRSRTGSISINIRLWQGERVAQEFKARSRTVSDDNFNDIETEKNIWVIKEPEPGKTATRNSFLFVAIDSFERSSKIFAGPGLYFNKDECVVFTADNIDLTAGAAAKITI
jgi:hypothetical protein